MHDATSSDLRYDVATLLQFTIPLISQARNLLQARLLSVSVFVQKLVVEEVREIGDASSDDEEAGVLEGLRPLWDTVTC